MYKNITLYITLFFLCIFGLGYAFPDVLWGAHFWHFTSLTSTLFTLVIVFLLLGFGSSYTFLFDKKIKPLGLLFIIVAMGGLFGYFSIVDDYYGNARSFINLLDQKYTSLPQNIDQLFTFNLSTGESRWGVVRFYEWIAYLFNISLGKSFKLAGIVFGTGCVGLLLLLIYKNIKQTTLQNSLFIVVLFSPFLLNFYHHIEVYALTLFLFTLWLYIYVIAFKNRNAFLLWFLTPLLILNIRFNTVLITIIPMYVISIVFFYHKKNKIAPTVFDFQKLILYIYTPLAFVGILLYFFVFKSHYDSRVLDFQTKDIDRLFLPLFSPKPPLDNYNLFSWHHILDYFQVYFFTCPSLLFWFVHLILKKYRPQKKVPLANIAGIGLLFLLSFLFMINPLMSLPMDWDLFCIAIPLALVCLILLLQETEIHQKQLSKLFISTLVIALLSIPSFGILFHQKQHSYRMESVGVRVYNTYYQHSDSYLLYALQRLKDTKLYNNRLQNLLKKLQPQNSKVTNKAYANLLLDDAINHFHQKNYPDARKQLLSSLHYNYNNNLTHDYITKTNFQLFSQGFVAQPKHQKTADSLILLTSKTTYNTKKALMFLKTASYYNPRNPKISFQRLKIYSDLKQYDLAFKEAKQLLQFKYPSHKKALKKAIIYALKVNSKKELNHFMNVYTHHFPKDLFLKTILQKNIVEIK